MPQKISFLLAVTTQPTTPGAASPHSGGWSESHWLETPRELSHFSIVDLATFRALSLPRQCSVIGVRGQLYTLSGNRILPGGSATAKLIRPGNVAWTVDVPQAGLEISATFEGRPNGSRFSLRGFPDECVINGEFSPVGNIIANITTFTNSLRSQAWGSIVRDLSQPSSRVLGITNGVLSVDDLQDWAVGQYLILRRCQTAFGTPVKGSFRISAIDVGAKTVTLPALVGTLAAIARGTVRRDQVVWARYAAFGQGRIGVKKIGGPFEKYRGRRSKQTA